MGAIVGRDQGSSWTPGYPGPDRWWMIFASCSPIGKAAVVNFSLWTRKYCKCWCFCMLLLPYWCLVGNGGMGWLLVVIIDHSLIPFNKQKVSWWFVKKTESLDDFGWVFMVIPCDTAHVSPAARPAHERPSAAKALHHPWIKVPWCPKNSLGMVECMDSYCDFLWEHMGHGDLMDGVKLTDIWIQNKKTLHI